MELYQYKTCQNKALFTHKWDSIDNVSETYRKIHLDKVLRIWYTIPIQ